MAARKEGDVPAEAGKYSSRSPTTGVQYWAGSLVGSYRIPSLHLFDNDRVAARREGDVPAEVGKFSRSQSPMMVV